MYTSFIIQYKAKVLAPQTILDVYFDRSLHSCVSKKGGSIRLPEHLGECAVTETLLYAACDFYWFLDFLPLPASRLDEGDMLWDRPCCVSV